MKKRRKVLVLLVQAAVVLSVLGVAGTVGFLEYSAQPGFCNNCHNMEPYYQSWLDSSHNMVPCIKCHYAPGIKAEAMGKVQAANQVVKYVTRTFAEKPWAEIEDAACTREGCHLEQRLGVVSYLGVRFDHRHHLGELQRGKDLRCTSCHSQIVQGEHLNVTPSSCALCHFKDRPEGQPLGGCLGCHPSPPNLEYEGVPIDHQQILRDLVSCAKCHSDVAVGDGAAEEQRCWTCHNLPDRIEQFGNPTVLHEVHIAEHNVECQQCHTEIQHKVVALEETLELDCSNCHRGAHAAQRSLVSGSGGHGVEGTPSTMFLARVSCESCHALPEELPGHDGVSQAGEATCLSCHGTAFAGILPEWEAEFERRVSAVASGVTRIRQAIGDRPGTRADSLLRAAEENVALVQVGRGAHNVRFADDLLRAGLALAQDAARAGGVDPGLASVQLGAPVGQGECATCHYGEGARGDVYWQGRRLPHRRHTVNAGMTCTTCHTPFSQDHGGLRIESTDTCDSCHHVSNSPEACRFCHTPPGADTVAYGSGSFIHEPHLKVGFTCELCHQAPTLSVPEESCAQCHSIHHTPDRNCRLCHGEDTGSKHMAELAHTSGCTLCHGGSDQAALTSWTPQVCLVCHQDQEEHSGGMECTLCHEIPPMGGGQPN
jgi:nitrate/TMAO reductase-like tetraheme cytochrome c subunit